MKFLFCCQVKLQMYAEYFRTIGMIFIMAIVFLCAFQQAASLAYNYWLSLWADDLPVNGTQRDHELKLGVFAALGFTQGGSKGNWPYSGWVKGHNYLTLIIYYYYSSA